MTNNVLPFKREFHIRMIFCDNLAFAVTEVSFNRLTFFTEIKAILKFFRPNQPVICEPPFHCKLPDRYIYLVKRSSDLVRLICKNDNFEDLSDLALKEFIRKITFLGK